MQFRKNAKRCSHRTYPFIHGKRYRFIHFWPEHGHHRTHRRTETCSRAVRQSVYPFRRIHPKGTGRDRRRCLPGTGQESPGRRLRNAGFFRTNPGEGLRFERTLLWTTESAPAVASGHRKQYRTRYRRMDRSGNDREGCPDSATGDSCWTYPAISSRKRNCFG